MTKAKAFTIAILAVLALAFFGAAYRCDLSAGIQGISSITQAFFQFGGDDDAAPALPAPAGPVIETFPRENP